MSRDKSYRIGEEAFKTMLGGGAGGLTFSEVFSENSHLIDNIGVVYIFVIVVLAFYFIEWLYRTYLPDNEDEGRESQEQIRIAS